MNAFSGLGLFNSQSSDCNNCPMQKKTKKSCCHDEHKIIQVDKDQKNTEQFISSLNTPVTYISSTFSLYTFNYKTGNIHPVRLFV